MAHQLYALCAYTRRPGGRRSYYRLSPSAFPLRQARRMYNGALLFSSLNNLPVVLRAVRTERSETAPGVGVLEYAAQDARCVNAWEGR